MAPDQLGQVDEAIELLLTGDHKFRTVVLDSLDWLEPIVWAATRKRNKWTVDRGAGLRQGLRRRRRRLAYFLAG